MVESVNVLGESVRSWLSLCDVGYVYERLCESMRGWGSMFKVEILRGRLQ